MAPADARSASLGSVSRARSLLLPLLGLLLLPGQSAEAKRVIRSKPVPREARPAAPRPEPEPEPEPEINTVERAPLVAATATVWAQAGSRSWTGCSSIASEAGKQLWNYVEEANAYRENHHWSIQAGECPNAPEVLTLAVRSELLRRFDLPNALSGETELSELEVGLAESRDRALAWIDDAELELQRRRDKRSLGLEYWRGRALLSLGDLPGAEAAFERALASHSVEGWKLRRMLALTALYAGDIERALVLGERADIDAPSTDKVVSYYVLALILDRAGDSAGAARRMKFARDRDEGSQLRALETALPVHERLYLRAYAQTVREDESGALRLWAAYLARPEPEAPERRLAERHQAALQPLPRNLGGPAHANEGAAASGRN